MKTFSLIAAVIALTVSALAQPGQTPYPATEDSPIWLRASKLWGTLPKSAATVQLLSAPLIIVSTGMVQIVGFDCASIPRTTGGNPFSGTTNSYRFAATLPGWDAANYPQVSAQISLTCCSNESVDTVKFSLRAGAVANGGNISSPAFGVAQTIQTNIPGQYALSQSTFAPLTIGGAANNSVVIFELSRLADSFTNAVTVADLSIFYAKSVSP